MRKLLLWLLAYKVLSLLITYFCALKFPQSFDVDNYHNNFHWLLNHQPGWSDFFMTWDAQPYLYLSQSGYANWTWPEISQFAFFPLWPAVMSLATHVIPDPLLGSLIIANAFSLIGWLYFYRLMDEMYGRSVAGWSLLFLICFPGALFFQFPYSESLFFMLTILFFRGLRAKNKLLTVVTGILLPLTRVVGVLLWVPALVGAWRTEPKLWRFLPGVAIAVGFLLYLGLMSMVAGDCMAGFKAQNGFISNASAMRIFDPIAFLKASVYVTAFHEYKGSLLDRLVFLVLLITLHPTYKLNKTFFCYSLLLGVLPAVSTHYMSYTRYAAVVFPMFLVVGTFFSKPERKYGGWLVAGVLLIMQVLLLLNHITFRWSG